MEAVVLCGVQGSGKTTLYRDRFLDTHVRVSLDVLRTPRARGRAPADVPGGGAAVRGRQHEPDARRPRAATSSPPGRPASRSIGYLVEVDAAEAFARNAARAGRARAAGRARDRAALQRPTPEEGFDELWHATAAPDGGWRIEPLLTTPPLFWC